MKATFQHFLILLFSILLTGCASVSSRTDRKGAEQDPEALTVPKRWILQSFTFEGEEKDTAGQGIWIAFSKAGGYSIYSRFDGVNTHSGYSDPFGGASSTYTATPDGRIHIAGTTMVTLVGVTDPDLNEERSRRKKLLHQADTFVCTGEWLILSDGSDDNQLLYLAQMPSSP
jgi:hypothetical protein